AVPVGTLGIVGDGSDEALAEGLSVAVEAGVDHRGGQPEDPGLPRGLEDQLAVAPGRRGGAGDVQLHKRATPIIESRVTRPAGSSSERSSVPFGRSGSTR